jgi:hypothetical protein
MKELTTATETDAGNEDATNPSVTVVHLSANTPNSAGVISIFVPPVKKTSIQSAAPNAATASANGNGTRPPALPLPPSPSGSGKSKDALSPLSPVHPWSRGHPVFSRMAPSSKPTIHRNYPFHIALVDHHQAQKGSPSAPTSGPLPFLTKLPPPHVQLHMPASYAQVRATIFLGAVTAFFMMPFNVAQNYITSLHPNVGSLLLVLIYSSYAVGSLIAPQIAHTLSMKIAFPLSACGYCIIVIAVNLESDLFLYISSVINGFSQGLFWNLEGVWMSRVSHLGGTAGLFTGIFWGLYGCNALFGDLIAVIVLQSGPLIFVQFSFS